MLTKKDSEPDFTREQFLFYEMRTTAKRACLRGLKAMQDEDLMQALANQPADAANQISIACPR